MKPILAVVFTQTPEHLVCFRFRSSASYIFVIFDAHSHSEHPLGPAFILANDVDAIATHFNQLLTQPSTSESASNQDVTTNHSFMALVIESRDRPTAIDQQDLLAKSLAFLSEKLSTVDCTSSNLDLDTPVVGLVYAPHKQDHDNIRQTSQSKSLTRRSEFGWQLNLQVSSTSSAVDPKNNNLAEHPKRLEIKKTRSTTIDFPKKSDFDLLILDTGPDGEDIVSNADVESIPDNTHSHLRNRTEFGWQLALQQQTSITDRRKVEDLEIVASTIVSQAEIQTHRVVVGKEKEVSDEFFETQTLKGSVSGWEDVLVKQLQEEEELVASSAGYLSQESAWILSLRKRLIAEEDKVNNAVASSSSTSYTQRGQKEITSTFLHGFDFEPFSSTEGESSTIHRHPRHSQLFPSYLDAFQSCSRGFTTLELPANEFQAETHECGVCNELFSVAQSIQLPSCTHSFCRECIRTFTITRISEGRYPIFCPVCAIERSRVNNSRKLLCYILIDG